MNGSNRILDELFRRIAKLSSEAEWTADETGEALSESEFVWKILLSRSCTRLSAQEGVAVLLENQGACGPSRITREGAGKSKLRNCWINAAAAPAETE